MGNFDRAIFTTSILNTIGSLLPRGWAWRRSAIGPLQTLLTVMNMVAFTGPTHDARAIADLYQRRWGIETACREAKGWHGLDALPGRSKPMVRQEVCALMLFWIMQGELEGQARAVYADEIRQQPDIDPAWTPAEGIAETPVLFKLQAGGHLGGVAHGGRRQRHGRSSSAVAREHPLPLAESRATSARTTFPTNIRATP